MPSLTKLVKKLQRKSTIEEAKHKQTQDVALQTFSIMNIPPLPVRASLGPRNKLHHFICQSRHGYTVSRACSSLSCCPSNTRQGRLLRGQAPFCPTPRFSKAFLRKPTVLHYLSGTSGAEFQAADVTEASFYLSLARTELITPLHRADHYLALQAYFFDLVDHDACLRVEPAATHTPAEVPRMALTHPSQRAQVLHDLNARSLWNEFRRTRQWMKIDAGPRFANEAVWADFVWFWRSKTRRGRRGVSDRLRLLRQAIRNRAQSSNGTRVPLRGRVPEGDDVDSIDGLCQAL